MIILMINETYSNGSRMLGENYRVNKSKWGAWNLLMLLMVIIKNVYLIITIIWDCCADFVDSFVL